MRTYTARVGKGVIIDGNNYRAEQARFKAGEPIRRPCAFGKSRMQAVDKLFNLVQASYADTEAASKVVVIKLIEQESA